MEGFCKWFRHDQNDIDFVINIVLIVRTDGFWIWIMMLYYWLFKRKENSNGR